jgi:teichoic acid transport system permease protein
MGTYVSQLWRRRDFAWFLAKGNIKARHASTTLGILWWVLNPLLLGLVYFFVFGFLIPSGRDIAYLLSGMFVFHFSSQALSGGAGSILQNSKLLVNISFPRLILPISHLLESAFGFGASLLVLYAIIIPLKGIWPTTSILLLAIVFPLQLLFNLGLGAITARLAVPFRDIQNLLVYINRLWLYTSPIIWPLTLLDRLAPATQRIMQVNPMFSLISVYRSALLGYPLDMNALVTAALWSAGVFVVGVAVFVKYEGRMVRYL